MFFPRLSSVLPLFLLSTAISSFAAPAPTTDVVVKRQDGIVAIVQQLKDATGALVISTNDLVTSGGLNEITGAAQITELIAALTTAGTGLDAFKAGASKRDLIAVRQLDIRTVVANLLAEITKDVVAIVGQLSALPLLAGLLSGVDVALAVVLTGLGILLDGVLLLVGTLLGNLGAALTGIPTSAGLLGL